MSSAFAGRVSGIQVHRLSKALLGKAVLKEASFVVDRGKMALIEGDNGAGKTTLIRVLATVVSADSGTALLNGHDLVKDQLGVRRSVGVSFSNERSLYWRISGYQNLELFGKIAGLSSQAISERSSQLLKALDLRVTAFERVARMSTGQRQRLMVARALLADPAVLLLDEPFRGLDSDGLMATIDLISEKCSNGVTTLIVAPLIEAIVPRADATFRLAEGRVYPKSLGGSAVPVPEQS